MDQISIVDNVTTAAAIVLQRTGRAFSEGKFSKNDDAVTLSCAFPAVKKSFDAYVGRVGGHLVEVELPFPVNSNNQIINKFRNVLQQCRVNKQRVRLALIDHVSSMPSVVIPVKELVKVCREEGVDQVFIDGAHAIGSVEVDMIEIGADFYVSNLHKWFFCPHSIAVLYCRKMDESSDLHHPIVTHEYGNGLAAESGWIGTRDYSSQLVVPDAMEFVNRFEGGIEGIRRRNHENVVEMAEMLARSWGTGLGSPPEMCASMVMIGLPSSLRVLSDLDALALRTRLRDGFGVEVPIYYRAPKEGEVEPVTAYARISYQVYNMVDDYYRLRDAINELVEDGVNCADLSR